jgi:hypothetical protein
VGRGNQRRARLERGRAKSARERRRDPDFSREDDARGLAFSPHGKMQAAGRFSSKTVFR